MNSFRIIAEETHKYKKDSLFVLMFKDGEKYGIDVTNSTSNFGRVNAIDRDKVGYLFFMLNEYINDQTDYLEACTNISSILSYGTYEKVVLSLHTHRRHIDKMEAYAVINMLGLSKSDKKMIIGTHIIKVYKKSDDETIGEFISVSDTDKFLFHFF